MEEQLQLHKSTVTILGVGGGGGCVAEILARMGVGNINLVDGDMYEESNINRQIGATRNTIGYSKALVMRNRLKEINPRCNVRAYIQFVNEDNFSEFVAGSDVVCDTVDGVKNKLTVGRLCKKHGYVEVTGGLGGYGYWASILKNKSIDDIFKDPCEGYSHNPCCSSVFAQAALQAHLITLTLLNKGKEVEDKIVEGHLMNLGMAVMDID